jgi:hypothetical protein
MLPELCSRSAGYKDDAARHLEQLIAARQTGYVSPVWLAGIFAALNLRQQADEQMAEAVAAKSYPLIWRRTDPRLRMWA